MLTAVVRRSERLLRPGGRLVVEHSDRQGESAPAVAACLREGWVDVQDHTT
jgi:release factor glutamine methyltransferase